MGRDAIPGRFSRACDREHADMFPASRKGQGGQALIMLVVLLPFVLGVAGLAFDIGFLEMMQRRVQAAADAGAIAGSIGLPYSQVTAGADAGTAANGFTTGSNGATVTVNNPPTLGPNSGNSAFVEVIVTQSTPTFFLRMIGIAATTNVKARAVATNLAGDCIFALDPSASSALSTAIGIISVPSCAIVVDSSSGSALSGFLSIINASQISIHGGNGCFLCLITPSPITGATPLGDPLAYLPAPTLGSCTGTAVTITHLTASPYTVPLTGCPAVTLDSTVKATQVINFTAGAYSSITMNSGIAPTVNFGSGLYTIQGSGGLSLTGTGATIAGSAVTFYLGPSAGGLTLFGGGSIVNNVNLVAPTTGTYAAILFFQSPSNTNSACIGGCGYSISGIFNFMRVEGALYFPKATVSFTGCCQNSAGTYYTAYEIIVADKITLFFNYFNDDYSSLPGGSPIKKTVLSE